MMLKLDRPNLNKLLPSNQPLKLNNRLRLNNQLLRLPQLNHKLLLRLLLPLNLKLLLRLNHKPPPPLKLNHQPLILLLLPLPPKPKLKHKLPLNQLLKLVPSPERCPFMLPDFKPPKCKLRWTKLSPLLIRREPNNRKHSRTNQRMTTQLDNFKV